MKKCSEVKNNISLYIDNELDLDERREFEEHIASCRFCKNELNEMMKIVNVCRETIQEELPEDFNIKLHKKLLETSGQDPDNKNVLFFHSKYFKIISSIAAVFLLFFLMRGYFDFNFSSRTKSMDTAPDIISSKAAGNADIMMKAASPEKNDGADNYSGETIIAGRDISLAQSMDQTGKTNGNDTGRAETESRENQYSMKSAAEAHETIALNITNIVISDDNPSAQLDVIRDIAIENNGAEQDADEYNNKMYSYAFTAKSTESLELYFKIPNEQFSTFVSGLNKSFGLENIAQDAIVTEDMSSRLEELLKQIDALDLNIDDLENKNEVSNQKEIDKLNEEKIKLQNELEAIRLNTDFTYVKVVLNKNSN